MPKRTITAPITSPWDPAISLLSWLATCVAVLSFLFFYKNGQILLYGDAVAHINIARRVFDSKTPGLLQLGTVWLPLPHLLMIPFLISDEMWHRGLGGSIPSMVGYVFGVIGMFRLLRDALARGGQPETAARVAAWIAALVYAANPNLIYMQATAMGEAVYLALFIWAVVFFAEFVRGDARALTKCGGCLAAACLTRYDGWFVSAAMMVAAVSLFFRRRPPQEKAAVPLRPALIKFLLIAAAAPALWLVYNGLVYRNPLEFENGPYSAKAIERRTQTAGNPTHPGSGHLIASGLYFVKAGEMNMAENTWLERLWVFLLLAALIAGAFGFRAQQADINVKHWWPLVFLLLPIPFYALSVAYGGVPIFVPPWWPFSHYNVRYGLQLLPAFSAALAILLYVAIVRLRPRFRLQLLCLFCGVAAATASYATVWRAEPRCLKEAETNMRTRNQLERQVAEWLQHLPPDSTLLMYLGDHVGALQQANIPLRHVINEGNHRVWKQPSDPEGLWESALANPGQYADYVVAFDGDSVWQAVQGKHLQGIVEIHVTGQPRAILSRAR